MKSPRNKTKIPMTRDEIIRVLRKYPELWEKIEKMLLDRGKYAREVYVLKQVYGLNGDRRARKLTDVARDMERTPDRVRQLRDHGLKLLCHQSRKQAIEEYVIARMIEDTPLKTKQKILSEFETR